MSIPGPEVARTAPDRKVSFAAFAAQKTDGAHPRFGKHAAAILAG
jgi:hypothetical protein